MKKWIKIQSLKFYLFAGLGYLLVHFISTLAENPETFAQRSVNEIWHFIYILPVIYLFFEIILPRLSRKRIIRSLFYIAVQIFLFSVIAYLWRSIGILLHIYTPFKTFTNVSHGAADQMGASMGALIYFALVRHLYLYNKLRQSEQQLRIEKQQAELNYLKSQTNPHFLFNTLNNIYSLSRDKSDLAPESILRLSKILRFMLYEAGGNFIPIEDELKIIGDYIDLEKLRYDESLRVSFSHNVEDMKQAVPPLLMVPLVENAFKHGVAETRNQPFVEIYLSVKNRVLLFTVKNSHEELQERDNVKMNIGLSNLKRQLALLYKEYDLKLEQADFVFTATLKINLSSYVNH